jgi:hypothetical protein
MALAGVVRWSPERPVAAYRLAGAAAGMAGPVAYGTVAGHPSAGMPAAIGALAMGGLGRPAKGLAIAAGAVTLAAAAGAAAAGHGWASVALVTGLAFAVALVCGVSRPAAETGARFTTFALIATGLHGTGSPPVVAAKVGAGAFWTALVLLALSARRRKQTAPPGRPAGVLLRRWWRSLHGLAGWRYALRLGLCLAAAETIGMLWHQAKAYWIAVTVVIVVRRRLDGALARPLQRAAGTAAGVAAGSVTLLGAPSSWPLVAVAAALAGLRPLLKEANYALYAAVMTPLVVLLLDFGRPASAATIGYRLADTAIGCALALTIGYLPWRHRDLD